MLTRERSLAIFLSATDELINSKYILADSKVGAILKAVAQSRMLYETFEYVTYGYDYSAAKSVCFVDGGVSLPQKDEDVLAFVFLTLMEMRILNDYFGGDNGMQNAYATFADKMLKPFRDIAEKTFGKIISGEMPTVGKGEKKAENAESQNVKTEKKASAVSYAITLAEDEFARSGSDGAEELAYILKELRDAEEKSDADKITLACLALKYAVKSIKRPKLDTDAIFEEVSVALQ